MAEVMTMKRVYLRPSIHVEPMQLDTAIAASNCIVNKADFEALQRWGYFVAELACSFYADGLKMGEDTICYHSNIRTVLTS